MPSPPTTYGAILLTKNSTVLHLHCTCVVMHCILTLLMCCTCVHMHVVHMYKHFIRVTFSLHMCCVFMVKFLFGSTIVCIKERVKWICDEILAIHKSPQSI